MKDSVKKELCEEMIVYHGGTETVEHPNCKCGRRNLDFGQGFYVTNIRKQAEDWAKLMADRRKKTPILNRYRLIRDAILAEARCKVFKAYDEDWLEFIVASRQGRPVAEAFDYIEGGVANDRVVDTVTLYMTGLMDKATALRRLSEHQPNNQMCLLNQVITDKYLIFDGTEEI